MKLVSVNILNRDQKNYLGKCIDSILKQTYRNLEIIITDNFSTDGSAELIKKEYPQLKFIQNRFNEGYAKAHDKGIGICKGDYVIFLNADIILKETFIEEIIKVAELNQQIGMAQGKLYRMGSSPDRKILDSTGIIFYKNRRNLDKGFAESDIGQYNNSEYIFGASGAAFFCRRNMLEDIKIGDEYFDEDFFAYREEVDLAWRAQLLGWKCIYAPNAIAYHYRTYSPDRRRYMPKQLKQLQYRNRYLMLIKNELPLTFILHLPYILLYEVISFLYVLFCEPFLIKTWLDIIRLLPKMLKKRKQIMKKRRVSARYILSIIK